MEKKTNNNVRLTNMNKTSLGYMSKVIDEATYDALQKVEKGGRLTLVIKEGKFGEFASLEFITKDDVDAYAAKNPRTYAKTATDGI